MLDCCLLRYSLHDQYFHPADKLASDTESTTAFPQSTSQSVDTIMATVRSPSCFKIVLLKETFRVSVFAKIWHQGYGPFERIGEDTFMVVSPVRNVLWTCDSKVILQVLGRRNDFPKPVMALKVLNLYGPTITGTEGPESRLYRKITSPFFNDKTHLTVWADSLQLTGQMMKSWLEDKPAGDVLQLNPDTARLTLCIISRVCFGKELEWANKHEEVKKIPPGHTMTYNEAIVTMLERISVILFAPPILLSQCSNRGTIK